MEKNFQSHSKHPPFDICSAWLEKTVLTFLESFVGIIVETVRCDNYHDTNDHDPQVVLCFVYMMIKKPN